MLFRSLLVKSGYAEEVVLGWSREQLMSKYVDLLTQGWDPAVVTRPVDPEVKKMRLAHEMEMKRMELEAKEKEREDREKERELREKELEAEKERKEKEFELEKQREEAREKERELRQKELDAEREKMMQTDRLAAQQLDFEREKLKSEAKLKEQEIDVKERAQNDEMKLLKRYGDALAQVISTQPEEVTDLPAYFRGVEEQFKKLNVPRKYQARLIYKYLSARARTLCSRIEPDVRDDYDRMKTVVLKEHGLTARCFLERFKTMKKPFNDTVYFVYFKVTWLTFAVFQCT